MSKNKSKYLLALAAVGTVIGVGTVFLKKRNKNHDEKNEFSEDFEDEDFDLDSDLEPLAEREYVSLNNTTSSDDNTTDENS